MKILALGHDVPGTTDEQFAPHLDAEARRVWDLHQQGVIRELSPGCLATLPLVRERLIDFDLVPLRAYPGFGRLFAAGG